MTRSPAPLMTLLAASLLALSACEKKSASPDTATESAPATTSQSAPVAPAQDAGPTLQEAVDAVIAGCEISRENVPRQCKKGELKALKKVLKKKQLGYYPEVVKLLASQDMPTKRVAAHILERHMYFWLRSTQTTGGPDRAATERLLNLMHTFNPRANRLANSTIRFAMDAATLLGMHSEARELLKRFDPEASEFHRWVYYQGLGRSMAYARMALFDVVEEAAKSPHDQLRQAAFQAPDAMNKWSKPEEERLCAWAASYLKEDDARLNGGPAKLLLRCSDVTTWRNKLLDEASQRVSKGTYKRPFAFALDRICEPAIYERTPPPGESICRRSELLLRQIVEDEKLPARERAHAISALARQFPNQDTVAYIGGIQSKNPAITQRVQKTLKDLSVAKPVEQETGEQPAEE